MMTDEKTHPSHVLWWRYTESVIVAGRGSDSHLRLETTVEHGKTPLFPFFTGLNNNPKERLDLKDMLQQLRALTVK